MDRWILSLPTKVEFGEGALSSLATHAAGYKKALVVTGRNAMRKAGVTDRVCALLKEAGVESFVFADVSPDPDCTEVSRAGEIVGAEKIDLLVAVGGGSAIDCAKAVSVIATNPGEPMDYVMGTGTRAVENDCLPVIAVSATSGTGSHIGKASVLSDRSKNIKRTILSDRIYPKVAVCDPEVLKTMPPSVTAATGFDAFTHAFEGYLSSVENPMGNVCAAEAIKIILKTLPAVYKDGSNLELRARMSWAETLAGVSLASNGISTPHALAMVAGGKFHITHGVALAMVTPAWIEHTAPGAKDKFAAIAGALGYTGSDPVAFVAETVKDLIVSIGLTERLADYGVKESDLEALALDARAGFDFRIKADPVPPTDEETALILKNSL
ncbi:MAG: iron-containing alcohol dehydrogenase [Abditibacteriota bacterium]|nr:iron-containing alcohol dehydrogenase [Abditibacteriota bacterium]